MMTRHVFALVATLSLAGLFAACGARSDTDTRRLSRTPEGVASVRIERAIQHAESVVNSDEWQRVPVRHNPTHCGSPPWEAHLYGAWRRVVLQPVPKTPAHQMSEAWLRAFGEVFESEDGWNYPVLQWRAVDQNEALRP